MRYALLAAAGAALLPAAAPAQNASITLYELPAYLGRSVTITAASPTVSTARFGGRAQSARVEGEWEVCPQASYAGTCQTLTADAPLLRKVSVASVRPAGATATAATGSATSTATGSAAGTAATAAGAGTAAVDLDALDAGAGTEGQDVAFFAQPQLGGTGVSAGSNDLTAAGAFCKAAGFTSAAYAARGRTQMSGIIDIASRTKVRAFPLRDVLCRK